MNVWEMAQECARLAGENATPNRGLKSKAYREMRQELVNCSGVKETQKLLREAFAARRA